MPTEPEPITLAQLVHRAVEVCDDGSRPSLTELLERFEDADEPVSALADVEQRLDEALGPVDFDEGDGALTMARAVIVYLAHRRDELAEAPDELLLLAARAEFDGAPPEYVSSWLAARGLNV